MHGYNNVEVEIDPLPLSTFLPLLVSMTGCGFHHTGNALEAELANRSLVILSLTLTLILTETKRCEFWRSH